MERKMFNNYGSIVDRECQCQSGFDTEDQMEGRTVVNNYGTIISRKCTGRANRKIFRLGTLNNYGGFVYHKCCCDSKLLLIGNLNNYGTIINCRSSSCPLNPTDRSTLLLLGHSNENVSMSATLENAISCGLPKSMLSGSSASTSSYQTTMMLNPYAGRHLNNAPKGSQGDSSSKPLKESNSPDYLKHFSPLATSTPKKPSRKRTLTFSSPANPQKPPSINEAMMEALRVIEKVCGDTIKKMSVPVIPNNISKIAPKTKPQENPLDSKVNPKSNAAAFLQEMVSLNPQRSESVERIYTLHNPQKREQECCAPPPKQPRLDDLIKQEKQEVIFHFGKLFNYLKTTLEQGYENL